MDKHTQGLELLNRLHGGHTGEDIMNAFGDVCPKMAEMTIEIIFGDLLQRQKELDLKTRELTIIASLVTLGNAPSQLRAHIEAALTVGASKTEISEVILQTAYFAGFPAGANAFIAVKDLLTN